MTAHPKLATFGIGLAITFVIGTAIGMVNTPPAYGSTRNCYRSITSPSAPSPPPPQSSRPVPQQGAARIIVTEDHVIHTAGSFFMIHYVASRKIMNRGTEASNHIVLGISIRDAPSRAGIYYIRLQLHRYQIF